MTHAQNLTPSYIEPQGADTPGIEANLTPQQPLQFDLTRFRPSPLESSH